MTQKSTRRDFLKWTGRMTVALAALWAVAPDLSVDGADVPEPEVLPPTAEPDIWNEDCHPYYCSGGVAFKE